MNKKTLSFTVLIGLMIGLFIIQLLGTSLFMYYNQGGQDSWWYLVKIVFKHIISFGDFDQILKNVLFGILGINVVLMFYVIKKIFPLDKLKSVKDRAKKLIKKGKNEG